MAEVTPLNSAEPNRNREQSIWLWVLGVTLCADAILLWLGLTEDAITVGKTLKKELLGLTIRLVDERQTFSIISAIFKLRSDGNYFLFFVIFLFFGRFPDRQMGGQRDDLVEPRPQRSARERLAGAVGACDPLFGQVVHAGGVRRGTALRVAQARPGHEVQNRGRHVLVLRRRLPEPAQCALDRKDAGAE